MKKVEIVSQVIWDVTYVIEDSNTGVTGCFDILINTSDYKEAKEFLFNMATNDHVKIVDFNMKQKTIWKEKKDNTLFSDFMPVICIKENGFGKNGVKGEKYFIKRSSVYMDPEGDAYGELYNDNEGTMFMANVKLKRFMSV